VPHSLLNYLYYWNIGHIDILNTLFQTQLIKFHVNFLHFNPYDLTYILKINSEQTVKL